MPFEVKGFRLKQIFNFRRREFDGNGMLVQKVLNPVKYNKTFVFVIPSKHYVEIIAKATKNHDAGPMSRVWMQRMHMDSSLKLTFIPNNSSDDVDDTDENVVRIYYGAEKNAVRPGFAIETRTCCIFAVPTSIMNTIFLLSNKQDGNLSHDQPPASNTVSCNSFNPFTIKRTNSTFSKIERAGCKLTYTCKQFDVDGALSCVHTNAIPTVYQNMFLFDVPEGHCIEMTAKVLDTMKHTSKLLIQRVCLDRDFECNIPQNIDKEDPEGY